MLLIHKSFIQLRNLSKRIHNSPTLRADLEATCVKSKIKPMQMVRDVATRWNSTAMMLGRALQMREAINLLVISEHHNRPRSVRLRHFQLSKAEWDLLDKLYPLLEVSFRVSLCKPSSFTYTHRFSSSRCIKSPRVKPHCCTR